MRRLALLLALAVGVSLVPTGGAGAAGEQEWQFVSGNIKLLTRFTDGDGGFPGAGRRLWNASQLTNGLITYIFRVEPDTWMGRFEIEVTREGGAGLGEPFDPADLGVYLYEDLADAANGTPTTTAEYDVREPGGEIGFIPPGTRYAIVFMSRGLDVDFTYRGFTPMTVDATATGFTPADVEVGSGGWVVFENVDTEFHGVRADDGSFDSSPTPKHPLRPGDTFAVRFLGQKEIGYFDPFASDASGQPFRGLIRVVPGPGEGTPA